MGMVVGPGGEVGEEGVGMGGDRMSIPARGIMKRMRMMMGGASGGIEGLERESRGHLRLASISLLFASSPPHSTSFAPHLATPKPSDIRIQFLISEKPKTFASRITSPAHSHSYLQRNRSIHDRFQLLLRQKSRTALGPDPGNNTKTHWQATPVTQVTWTAQVNPTTGLLTYPS